METSLVLGLSGIAAGRVNLPSELLTYGEQNASLQPVQIAPEIEMPRIGTGLSGLLRPILHVSWRQLCTPGVCHCFWTVLFTLVCVLVKSIGVIVIEADDIGTVGPGPAAYAPDHGARDSVPHLLQLTCYQFVDSTATWMIMNAWMNQLTLIDCVLYVAIYSSCSSPWLPLCLTADDCRSGGSFQQGPSILLGQPGVKKTQQGCFQCDLLSNLGMQKRLKNERPGFISSWYFPSRNSMAGWQRKSQVKFPWAGWEAQNGFDDHVLDPQKDRMFQKLWRYVAEPPSFSPG